MYSPKFKLFKAAASVTAVALAVPLVKAVVEGEVMRRRLEAQYNAMNESDKKEYEETLNNASQTRPRGAPSRPSSQKIKSSCLIKH